MKNLIGLCLGILIFLQLTSCATTKKWESLNTRNLKENTKEKTLVTIYTKKLFEARFMDVAATLLNASSNAMSQYSYYETGRWTNPAYIEKTTEHRKASSEFEKKLGSFDVLTYFVSSFDKMKDSLNYFVPVFPSDSLQSPMILKQVISGNKNQSDISYSREVFNSGAKYISAIKFQYGVGARAGKEQFGMKKTYRPFVRIVGVIKDINTNEIIWGNKMTVFSEKAYKGRDEAKEEFDFNLIKSFKVICDKLSRFLVEDLNGKQYFFPEGLVDYSANDDIL
jgi:hypothetical protein